MKAEDLMEAMGELDPFLVAEALAPAAPEKKQPARLWLRFAAAAAVCILVGGGVWAAVSRLPAQKSGSVAELPTETTTAPLAEATAAVPAATGSAGDAPKETPANGAAPAGTEPAATASTTASSSITAAPPETGTAAVVTNAPTKAAAPVTTAVPPAPETEAPSAQTEVSWWERLFGNAGLSTVQGTGDTGLLQRIAGLFSGGAPNGAGETAYEATEAGTEAPAGCYHAFYLDLAELQNRAAAYRSMPVTEKTQAELEALYGGPFLPTVFPGAADPPQESSGAPHGVRTLPPGDTVACNEYLYVWTTPAGDSRSLAMTADDGGYFPSRTIEDVCRTYQAGSATVYWLADTIGGEPRHLAIAARGDTAVFTFTLTGACSDEDFLRTVSSALGC